MNLRPVTTVFQLEIL